MWISDWDRNPETRPDSRPEKRGALCGYALSASLRLTAPLKGGAKKYCRSLFSQLIFC